MDNKRKASSSGVGIADGDDRATKRLKTPGVSALAGAVVLF
jgi:hypothetical protein